MIRGASAVAVHLRAARGIVTLPGGVPCAGQGDSAAHVVLRPAGCPGRPPNPPPAALFFTVFPSIMLPMFLAAIDQTIVATALPAIAGSLGDVERVSWVVVSYLVATTIAAPVYGRLGDVLGRRRLLFVALALFIAASLACALAPSILLLTAARVLQGLGGGGLMTTSQALVGEVVPPRERGRYQGYLASIFVASSTFGPVAGGWLTQQFGWQSVFLVNLPLGRRRGLLALRLPRRAGSGGRLQFDTLGVVLFAAFITPMLLALERLQRFDPASLPLVGRAGRDLARVAAAAAAAGAPGREPAAAAQPAAPAGDLALRPDGRLRRRDAGVDGDVRADLAAGGARHRPAAGRADAAADDGGDRVRLAVHRADDGQDRADGDLPLGRAGRSPAAALLLLASPPRCCPTRRCRCCSCSTRSAWAPRCRWCS